MSSCVHKCLGEESPIFSRSQGQRKILSIASFRAEEKGRVIRMPRGWVGGFNFLHY